MITVKSGLLDLDSYEPILMDFEPVLFIRDSQHAATAIRPEIANLVVLIKRPVTNKKDLLSSWAYLNVQTSQFNIGSDENQVELTEMKMESFDMVEQISLWSSLAGISIGNDFTQESKSIVDKLVSLLAESNDLNTKLMSLHAIYNYCDVRVDPPVPQLQ